MSAKIMKQAQAQQAEEEAAAAAAAGGGAAGGGAAAVAASKSTRSAASAGLGEFPSLGESKTAADLDAELDDGDTVVKSGGAEDGSSFMASMNINAADTAALAAFMPGDDAARAPTRSLADIIMAKIREKETEIASQMSEAAGGAQTSALDPKVIKVFSQIGEILSKYRSGKLPKAFKIIPTLKNWEEVLYVQHNPSRGEVGVGERQRHGGSKDS